MIPTDDLRFEVKAVAPEEYHPRLMARLRLLPVALAPIHPPRVVNNTYMDSADLSRLNQNYAGLYHRCKLRYRWYGEGGDAPAVLEFKHKHGQLGWKRLFPLQRALDLNAITWRQFFAALEAELSPEVWISIHNLTRPVLVNRYHREYLGSFDGSVRLTVDTEQRFYSQWNKTRPNLRFASPSPRQLVVEIKAPRQHEEQVRSLIQQLGLSISKNSKYVMGCESLTGLS